jgi:hypothetical protein
MERKCARPPSMGGHSKEVHSTRPRQTLVRSTKQLDTDKATQKRILHEEEEREQHKTNARSLSRAKSNGITYRQPMAASLPIVRVPYCDRSTVYSASWARLSSCVILSR